MKLLIVGASGLVGSNLASLARACGLQVHGTYASHPIAGLGELDLRNRDDAIRILDAFKPDAVACCSAWSWVDGCQRDPARAFLENAELPAHLAKLSHQAGARFLYFSSSYVFDGREGPYDENARPNPISSYGESKLRGEAMVMEATEGTSLIVRTMGVYGEEPQEKNFVYQVVRSLRAGKAMSIPSDQRGNASHAADVAAMVLSLLKSQASGVWNVAGPDPDLYRKDFALTIARAYDLDASLFRFVSTSELGQPAPRPLGGGLIIKRAVSASGHQPSAWRPIAIPK
ncbi:MAG TPA: SDR family oxidoreductase [Candidatus Methylacidiphilales bacterium]|jgi:dTDP-4-dehydrorhamnose reductase|nr:SDR family oxidoreductase [Candidatus Methylacidiphilales bacterium]